MERDRHHAALDGVRGFAALSVVQYHAGHWLDAPVASNSGLAVDLFFLLSGYVLTLAYKRRLDCGMTVSRFVVARLIRLMPLVVLGTAISAAYAVLRVHFKPDDLTTSVLGTATLLGCLDLPYLTAAASIGSDQVFPLNGPQYSLFFEVIANTAWAAVAALRRGWTAGALSVGCFVLLLAMGVLGGDASDTFLSGLPRVGASFLAGVAVFHIDAALPPWRWWPAVFWSCCAAMVATFYAPPLPFAVELAWITTVSPVLVLSGARTVLGGRSRAMALLAGRLSYPVYILHYPVFVWVNGMFQAVAHQRVILAESLILTGAVLAFSLLVLQLYDEPLRNRLVRHPAPATRA